MSGARPERNRLPGFLPLILFAALTAIFLMRLFSGDPSKLPSALIGKPVPAFALTGITGSDIPGLAADDLRKGRISLVNVFASWCAPCFQEHPQLVELARDKRFDIFGINQKDKPENARRYLEKLGNPYKAIGADTNGRASIEWGVYGVPETFVVSTQGRILYKHIGPLTAENIRSTLLPEIEKALKTP
jgi:cytochrome c biogenesis protein CcmG, thiol:disulfide interchange protein DsbE